ncbi:hypothetical protein [Corynebacterium phoceense]|uniref:hypothetical protein n=1 Tax=Corynebacterium phoceense TaxID=1686286 RepID=UPI00211C2324|nr:hypothetical protein [Corynebacterium phoceense]MCQ9331803.1 hypothetical protein [Corynebacterium phoceense]
MLITGRASLDNEHFSTVLVGFVVRMLAYEPQYFTDAVDVTTAEFEIARALAGIIEVFVEVLDLYCELIEEVFERVLGNVLGRVAFAELGFLLEAQRGDVLTIGCLLVGVFFYLDVVGR